MFFGGIPCDWGVATNAFIKFSFDQKHGVGYVVANLMELSSGEVVFAGSEEKGKFGRSLFEERPDVLGLLCNEAVELGRVS